MLNEKGQRELAYVVVIDKIEPIEGSDNCEAAYVGGWHIMVRKGTFQAGDLAIYFEIDSHLDTTKPEFAFLEKKHGNIKTQRYTFGGKGNFISQGLLMHPSDFGWTTEILKVVGDAEMTKCIDTGKELYFADDESRFLTKTLNVSYIEEADNMRKSEYRPKSKYAGKTPTTKLGKWLMKHKWGRVLVNIFGKKRKKNSFPSWIKKTDEERIQNCPWVLNSPDREWIATEKIDGSSTTFALKNKQFYVCSRNVCFDTSNAKCYYDVNIYTEMAQKYDMRNKLKKMLDDARLVNKNTVGVIVQAETYGAGVQRRDYGLKGHDMAIFNIIWVYKDGSQRRLNPTQGKDCAAVYDLPYVPVIGQMKLGTSCEEVLEYAGRYPSRIDGGMREGLVFRSLDGVQSFKAVNNEYLLKYHS